MHSAPVLVTLREHTVTPPLGTFSIMRYLLHYIYDAPAPSGDPFHPWGTASGTPPICVQQRGQMVLDLEDDRSVAEELPWIESWLVQQHVTKGLGGSRFKLLGYQRVTDDQPPLG